MSCVAKLWLFRLLWRDDSSGFEKTSPFIQLNSSCRVPHRGPRSCRAYRRTRGSLHPVWPLWVYFRWKVEQVPPRHANEFSRLPSTDVTIKRRSVCWSEVTLHPLRTSALEKYCSRTTSKTAVTKHLETSLISAPRVATVVEGFWDEFSGLVGSLVVTTSAISNGCISLVGHSDSRPTLFIGVSSFSF